MTFSEVCRQFLRFLLLPFHPRWGLSSPPAERRRVCSRCGQPIRRGHKYTFDGSAVKHRNCVNPESYR